jgi:hypothetical protein
MLPSINPADVISSGSRNPVDKETGSQQGSADSAPPRRWSADDGAEQHDFAADLAHPSGTIADPLTRIVLTGTESRILSAMSRMNPSTIESIAESVGLGLGATTHGLEHLRGERLIEVGSGDPFHNYCMIVDRGRDWLSVWGFPK